MSKPSKRYLLYLMVICLAFSMPSCDSGKQKTIVIKDSTAHVMNDSTAITINQAFPADTFSSKDIADKIEKVRENFKRVNSITNWASVTKRELELTTEGGEATMYSSGKGLEKVVVQLFGETFQQRLEYYLLDGKLSFVFAKAYRYNRPIYYDSTAMKENNDTETFDHEKSEVIEERSYFDKGKLFHRISSNEPGKIYDAKFFMEEEKSMLEDFYSLIK